MASTYDMAAAARAECPLDGFIAHMERAAMVDRARSCLRDLERQQLITPRASMLVVDVLLGRASLEGIAVCQELASVLLDALAGKGGAA